MIIELIENVPKNEAHRTGKIKVSNKTLDKIETLSYTGGFKRFEIDVYDYSRGRVSTHDKEVLDRFLHNVIYKYNERTR